MNITREQTGELTATIKMEIGPEDYQEKVDKVLADYKRKASIPGFRPGHVPLGLVRKMYGKAILADEVNKMLSDGIMNYIREEKLDILGNPLPNPEKNSMVNFDTDTTFNFWFDIGFAPVFTVPFDHSTEVEQLLIKVDDGMVEKYIEETRERHGDYIHPEVSTGKCMVSGEVAEINESGEVEGGIRKQVFLYLNKMTVDATREQLTGITKDTTIELVPAKDFSSIHEASEQLGLKEDQLSREGMKLKFTVQDIVQVQPAELNAEFFEKVYPGENISSEDEFRERIRKDAAMSFQGETDKLLFNKATAALVAATHLTLPDEFMKRWLLENNEGKYTPDQIEAEYPLFLESMKWQLIENRLIRDYEVQVKDEDIRNYIRTVMLRRVMNTTPDEETEKKYESIVDAFMQNKEQVQRINDQLYNVKLLDLLKQHLKLNTREVTYDEFINIVSTSNEHKHHEHHHDHDHDHGHDHHHDHDHDHKH